MARRRLDEWNLRFGVSWNTDGYTWQEMQIPTGTGEIEIQRRLAPAGSFRSDHEPAPGVTRRIAATARRGHTELRHGIPISQRAYREFRALARSLHEYQEKMNALGMGAIGRKPTESEQEQLRLLTEEAERRVVAFANTFGTLWGDDDPRRLNDWVKEALDFHDAVFIADGINTGKDHAFRNPDREGSRLIIDDSTIRVRTVFRLHTIATKGSWVEIADQVEGNPTERVDWFDRMLLANPRQRARFLFRKLINRKLDGGLSLEASLLSRDKAVLTPRRLVDLLYVRLWLDADRGSDPARTCEVCTTELEGKQRRFCSDACKQKHRRRMLKA
jgi:hypothetical protein